MASGNDDQPINSPTKINLLDGDMLYQIKRYSVESLEHKDTYKYLNITTNIDRNLVYNAHLDFLKSGSTLIRTNTYHALYSYLQVELGLDEIGYTQLVQNAVNIAVQSAVVYCLTNNIQESSLNIVGSCGCFKDKILDDLPLHELIVYHRHRIRILVDSGVNMLSLEGIRSIKEAEMLLDIVREFENTKTLVMFDTSGTNGTKSQLCNLVNWIQNCYNFYGPIIIAIGLNNINDDIARRVCRRIIKERETENLIPLVMCIDKDSESWNPVNVNMNAPVLEWQKFGIRYIGGGKYVEANDIVSLREKLNS